MTRILLIAALSTLFLGLTPAYAQEEAGFAWQDSAGAGSQGYSTNRTIDSQLTSLPTGQQTPLANLGSGALGIAGMGVATGMPIPGTTIAPANLALQVQNHSPVGGSLPVTNLDSIVAQSGYSDLTFGDEGTDGPPPYSGVWGTISEGVTATTGHPSDAPPVSGD
jgi:hypothetical protein